LEVASTLCHEVRQAESLVAIDHVKDDVLYFNHHTPLKYGFQSYISVPINRKDGTFFGTLCTIDPEPNQLKNEKAIGMFTLFAESITGKVSTSAMRTRFSKCFNVLKPKTPIGLQE